MEEETEDIEVAEVEFPHTPQDIQAFGDLLISDFFTQPPALDDYGAARQIEETARKWGVTLTTSDLRKMALYDFASVAADVHRLFGENQLAREKHSYQARFILTPRPML